MALWKIDGGGTFERSAAVLVASSHSVRGAGQNVWTDLYRTRKGAYVFHFVSQWQGARSYCERASMAEAADFALEHDGESNLPPDLREYARSREI